MTRLNLPVHSYQHISKPVGVERLVNCFAEKSPPEGKAPVSLMRSPGIVTATSSLNVPGRGIFNFGESLYVVAGSTLYRMASDFSLTSIGSISGTSVVTFAANPTQIVICDPAASYVYDLTTLSQITGADFRNGAQVCSLDGYVIFREPNSGRFFSSDLNDATSYNALMFATAEGRPDNLNGILTDHRQIFLAGFQSIELWYNAGQSGFPFLRDANGYLEIGCAAGLSIAQCDNSIFWLASDLTVRRLDGLTPVRISQHGVEQAIASYSTISDAYATSFSQAGHLFYVLNFPTAGHTWVYDATTTEWHERESYGYSRWNICSTANCYGRTFCQNSRTGNIGYFDLTTYTEFDDIQRMEFTFPSIYTDGERHFHNSLQLRAETGVGLSSGQGSDPQMTLEVSDDGGRSYTTSATKSLGLIGKRKTLVIWDRLGYADDRTYRCSISDPVKTIIADAQLSID